MVDHLVHSPHRWLFVFLMQGGVKRVYNSLLVGLPYFSQTPISSLWLCSSFHAHKGSIFPLRTVYCPILPLEIGGCVSSCSWRGVSSSLHHCRLWKHVMASLLKKDSCFPSLLTWLEMGWFPSRRSWGLWSHAASWKAAWEARFCWVYAFPVNAGNPSSPHLWCVTSCLFSFSIVVRVYVFPLSKIENQTSPLFWDCVMLPSFSLWVWGCCLPLVLGCFLVAEVANIFWDCCWVFLATQGPRTTLKHCLTWTVFHLFVWGCHLVIFTFFTELWIVFLTAECSGWYLDDWE